MVERKEEEKVEEEVVVVVVVVTWSSKRTISALPELAAQCKGDQPMVLNSLMLAPL